MEKVIQPEDLLPWPQIAPAHDLNYPCFRSEINYDGFYMVLQPTYYQNNPFFFTIDIKRQEYDPYVVKDYYRFVYAQSKIGSILSSLSKLSGNLVESYYLALKLDTLATLSTTNRVHDNNLWKDRIRPQKKWWQIWK